MSAIKKAQSELMQDGQTHKELFCSFSKSREAPYFDTVMASNRFGMKALFGDSAMHDYEVHSYRSIGKVITEALIITRTNTVPFGKDCKAAANDKRWSPCS